MEDGTTETDRYSTVQSQVRERFEEEKIEIETLLNSFFGERPSRRDGASGMV